MSVCWSCECNTALGMCGSGPKTRYCESFPGGCTGGDVGDLGILEKTPEEIEKSMTKFYGQRDYDGNLVLEGVGWLAAAGLRKGDVLLGADHLRYSDETERQQILTCQFAAPDLRLVFRYGNGKVTHEARIANLAYSLPRIHNEETE